MVTVTISDVDTGAVLLILETRTLSTNYPLCVSEAFAFRAADYPNPAFTLVPAISKPTSIVAEGIPMATLIRDIAGVDQPILETPGRLRKRWGPCRFTYGGRVFVRKPLQEGKPQSGDSVHEYTKTWPKPGSRTGKLDDDSSNISLFNIKYSIWSTQSASGAVGLDPLFKEYLFAVQLMKATTDQHGALPPKQSLAAAAGISAGAAAGAAIGTVGIIMEIVVALAGA
ncbi:hypothetical protein B0O99DRAFT_39543 [Bisporella sp. PMI_857]|nr:hypothetical protein B0O99DRAFT_39543 [Bisporella sp. PMI_857]